MIDRSRLVLLPLLLAGPLAAAHAEPSADDRGTERSGDAGEP